MAERKKTLLIVESPSKAKTIGKYLGPTYKVMASVGHIRDLPKSRLGIDIENNFEPGYINIRGKGDLIKDLKKEAKKAKKIYLATDPDREGEAISWHLSYILNIDPASDCRVEFNEITKTTIKEAIKHPKPINMGLVDAQQARRALDRLVGYQISPILWKKVKRGLSAGRVQSAALKMICDREEEIRSFKPEEYWNILANFEKDIEYSAKLNSYGEKKIKVTNRNQSDEILKDLNSGTFIIKEINKKKRKVRASAPFTTSSLQQEASNKFGFFTKRTMSIAQQLYEGIDIKGNGTLGLVTYIRTDSVRISEEAKVAATEYIIDNYGKEYLGNNNYKNKKKDIQDAHEAIRPSDVKLNPEEIKDSLTKDQYKLYKMIWSRFLASQMAEAVFDSVSVDIENGKYGFKANGRTLDFDGYKRLYNNDSEEGNKLLPELTVGEEPKLIGIDADQKFTQPPARYTEASLVKDLEEKNIGRPSTYSPIIATLTGRRYVVRDKKLLVPTELGFVVIGLLSEYFAEIVDAEFTAGLEDKLDSVELYERQWKTILNEFYGDFSKELKIADEEIAKIEMEVKLSDQVCELCGKPMAIKEGRFGEFLACTGYPECKNTKPIIKKVGVKCPECGEDLIVKKSRKGKLFYGCSGYPNCTVVFWDRPNEKKCPQCGSLLVEKKTKTSTLKCSNKECKYKE
ncbi:MAG: type I DNA topoisomerase [Peptostreptococcaceae bacterium]|nr:type I DNA topoisomerase [Peptostreptococcaceae bacterium]